MKKITYLLLVLSMFSLSLVIGCAKDEETQTGDPVVEPTPEEVKYVVTFDADGTKQTVEVKDGEKIAKPNDPVKEGYTFLGWYLGEEAYNFDTAVKADITLIAKFEEAKEPTPEEVKYVVTFDVDGAVTTAEVKEGEKATKPSDPVKEGYIFTGWYLGEEAYNFEAAVTSDITVVAKFEEVKKYTVTFDVDGALETAVVLEGEKVSKPLDPVKEGYTFTGWYVSAEELTTLYDFETAVTSDITLVAKFEEVKKYTVTFVVNGEVIYTEVVEEGKDATAPEAPEIEGAEFSCWDGNYENVKKDEEVIGIYDYLQFAVYFMVDGVMYGDPAEVEYGKPCELPAEPTKVGYNFTGWNIDLSSVKQDLVVHAVFEVLTYSIKYYSDGTELAGLEPSQYTIEDSVELPAYEVSDYTFYGWFNNSDFTGDALSAIKQGTYGDLELHAFNVKADINGGVESWTWDAPDGYDYSKGIDAISNLPEMFEMDFFKYLTDNNLLADSRVDSSCQVKTWAEFSGVNPLHNGDPKRIWNDTSSNKAGSGNGYVSVFLFDTIELNEDLTIKDVQGGFLGTEPYRTKYWGLLSSLVLMQNYKTTTSAKYTAIDASTNVARSFTAFTIDGYFYGTQGLSDSYFKELRQVIPGIDYGYKLSGETIVKVTYEHKGLPTPVKDGYVFAGWYLDVEGTKAIGSEKATNKQTVYAKWEKLA